MLSPAEDKPFEERSPRATEGKTTDLDILFLVIPLAILAIFLSSWAHLANRRRPLAIALYVVFGGFSLLFILIGGVGFLLADEIQRELNNEFLTRRDSVFLMLLGLAVGLPLLPPVRSALSRLMPINEKSISDMVGLSVMAGIAVTMVWTIDIANDDPDISPVTSFELIVQAALLLVIAYFGIGGAITRDLSNVRERLGLHMPTMRQVLISVALIIPLFIVAAIGGLLTEWLQPGLVEDIEDIMGEVTRDIATLQGALLLGITAGVGEEILFRGAIQPRYGIVFASLIFALIHVQYGFSFVIAGVFLTGIILGIQRNKMNTTCCIITHAVYNFTVVMLSTLA
jgi:uncharacterized protein